MLSINDSRTNELGGKLVESRQKVKEAVLADPGMDLSELVPASSA